MLFRTNIFVVRAIYDERTLRFHADPKWHDTVSYTFGINADTAADAAVIAVRGAEKAIDRDGQFVGGVVVEVQPKCVGPEEFVGYEKYLIRPLHLPGIFYVSGITYSSIGFHEANGIADTLTSIRNGIAQNGIPTPSFVHPQLEVDAAPKTVRIVCPVCERWVEVDHCGLLYSFFDGLDAFSPEHEVGRQAVRVAGPFVKRHFACLNGNDNFKALLFLYDGDERYATLADSKRD